MENIDDVWKKASERFPTTTSAWLKNFTGDLKRAQHAITDALKGGGYATAAARNTELRHQQDTESEKFCTTSSSSKTDGDEAVALLRLMIEQPQMTSLISSYVNDHRQAASNPRSRDNHILHVAAKNGSMAALRRLMKTDDVDVLNSDEETALHLAAEFDHADDVNILLELGATLRADKHGCTPLHSAAISNRPNATIARLLVRTATERGGDNFRLLNALSNVEAGRNSALHVASGNVNVTGEFIDELRDTDPRLQNADLDTAFHVAAKSSNPHAIIYLLSTFRPTNAGWDIDSVDENRGDSAPTLVNMCAGIGNAEAVALLIQHGADISQGVLHEIVTASVKKPEMTDKLVAVYQAVVDNAVTWRCLRDNRKCLIRGSSHYNELLRETMIYLTTKPFTDGKNMIQRAINIGASDMLLAILNTENVYKFDEFGVRRNDRLRVMCSYSSYDVTDFARHSPSSSSSNRSVESETRAENPENPAESREGDDAEVDFKKHHRPKTPYIEELLLHHDEWKKKNIFAVQPLRRLAKPYFTFVQRYYLFVGLIQLIFMGLFSAYYIPDTCTLAGMFGSVSSGCSNTSWLIAPPSAADETNTTLSSASATAHERESPSWLWLVWPVIMLVGSTVEFFIRFLWNTAVHLARHANNIFRHDRFGMKVLRRLNRAVWPTKMLLAAGNSFPLMSFCISTFVWFHRYAHCHDRQLYLEALSMVLLFGWMVNFVLFSGITQHLYVFLLVLNEIIVQDIILSFILVFIYTVVGFSFSLHALRMKIETATDVLLRHTIYDVFITALGIGSFFEDSKTELQGRMGLFRIVFAFYVCFAAIILLNILIAMMNSRYEKARIAAEAVWRYEVIKTAHILDDVNIFSRLVPSNSCNMFRSCFSYLYEDIKRPGRTFVDVRLRVENDD